MMTMNRRQFAQSTAAMAAVTALPLAHAADVVKIGYVSPQTGPLAPFGEADRWVIEQMKAAFKDGLGVGGKKHEVQIILKDSQSNPNRAGEVANDLILKDKVALMLTAGTPETANPVSDACELNEPAVHQFGGAVAAVVLRPQGRPCQGLRVDVSHLLGPGRRDRQFHQWVEERHHQQEGRWPVPQRRRRQRLGRQGTRLPEAAGRAWGSR